MKIFDFTNNTGFYKLSGQYERVLIKGGDRVVLDCTYLYLKPQSKNLEDTLILQNPVNVVLKNYNGPGSITVWGDVGSLAIRDCTITGGHYGIRATQHNNETYGRIFIHDCTIRNSILEGVYIGKSRPNENKIEYVELRKCKVSGTGWDGVQVGNCKTALIDQVEIDDCAKERRWGQDAYMINNFCNTMMIKESLISGPVFCLGGNTFYSPINSTK